MTHLTTSEIQGKAVLNQSDHLKSQTKPSGPLKMIITIIIHHHHHLHSLNVYFPYLHGLYWFLNGCLPLSWILCQINLQRSYCTSLSMTWYQVYRGQLVLCCLSTTTYKLFPHIFTMQSPLHLSTWPNYHNLLLLTQLQMLSRPKRSLSSEEGFLYFKVTVQIHLIILISLCSNLKKSASFTTQVSLSYSMTFLTHDWYTLPFKQREKPTHIPISKVKVFQ